MANDKNNHFELAYNKLTNMEIERKVDSAILKDFENLQKSFKELEDYWKLSEEIPVKEAFVLFHATRNSRMILERMRSQFLRAKEMHQNPEVVHSALLVLPRINDLYNMIEPLKKRKITSSMIQLIRHRLKLLRDIAENTSMLPTLEEEVKGVMASDIKKKIEIVANDLQATISEE